MFYIIGLGNPGEEYKESRHNTGKMAVELFAKTNKNKNVKVIEADTFMNHSGKAVAKYVKSKKAAENLIVVYDDIDLGLGKIKISYNKSSGGHRGLESIIKAVKTKEFTRVRVGITPTTPKGKIKKPEGEKKVLDFILGNFKPSEETTIKKSIKTAAEALETLVKEGRERAMNEFN